MKNYILNSLFALILTFNISLYAQDSEEEEVEVSTV